MKFHVDACAPRQPQRKGKVERRVRDQRAAIDPCGRSFRDLAELQDWTDARVAAQARANSSGPRAHAGLPSPRKDRCRFIS